MDAAAVAGNEFDIDIVVAASGVAAWPDGFTGSGLLTDRDDGRSAFRHPLTRDAAYADIPWSRRRHLHRALASTLTADRGAPALVAAHLLAARDFGPARRALLAAAEQYVAVHAYRDAARALRTALDHWPPGDEDEARLLAIFAQLPGTERTGGGVGRMEQIACPDSVTQLERRSGRAVLSLRRLERKVQVAEQVGRAGQFARGSFQVIREQVLAASVGQRGHSLRLAGGLRNIGQDRGAGPGVCGEAVPGEEDDQPLQDDHAVMPLLRPCVPAE